jgi:probable HAF family extracellular repeat protein
VAADLGRHPDRRPERRRHQPGREDDRGNALDARGLENAAIWTGGRDWRTLGSFTPNAQPCDLLLSATFGASDDGKVLVGLGWNGCRIAHAFRWEESTGMVDLGTSVPGESTRANNVSGDGRGRGGLAGGRHRLPPGREVGGPASRR